MMIRKAANSCSCIVLQMIYWRCIIHVSSHKLHQTSITGCTATCRNTTVPRFHAFLQ